MPPPPSFIDITTIPFSRVVTQAEFNGGTFGGVPNQVWFRIIITNSKMLGGFINHGGTFVANVTTYQSDGTTIVGFTHSSAIFSWNTALSSAGTYYIKVVQQAGGPSNFDFTVQFDTRPLDGFIAIPNYLVINDDTSGNPASVFQTNATIIGYKTGIPSGEIGAMLPSGISLWFDPNGDKGAQYTVALVDANLDYILSLNIGLAFHNCCISNSNTDFYILDRNNGNITKVSSTGVSAGVIGNIGISSFDVSAIGVNADGSVLYYANGFAASGNQTISAFNLLTNSFIGIIWTLGTTINYSLALTCNGHSAELLVLGDGTLVTTYFDETNQPTSERMSIVHLTTSGLVLQTYTYDDVIDVFSKLDHIAKIYGSNITVVIWIQDQLLQRGRIGIINLSTGVINPVFDTDLFEDTENLINDSATLFAPSESCTIFLLPTVIPPPPPPNPGSGIYKVVPGKRQDTLWNDDLTASFDTKIPNPFIRTGLIGE